MNGGRAVADIDSNRGNRNREIVAIGVSAGGLQPLQQIVADLPADLSAAVLIVQHIGNYSLLPQILGRVSRLPTSFGRSGEPLRDGHIYVAPPGVHMLVHESHILLRRGPQENLSRPAIDPLFRSVACSFGAAVIGVVLSGALNDGTAGLRAIKRCGGMAVVQADAAFPGMRASAQRHVDVDYSLPAAEIGALLTQLTAEPAGPTPEIPFDIRLETAIAAQELSGMGTEDRLGTPSRFTCPECHGTLWEITDGSLVRYRCHAGHAFSSEAMLVAQAQRIEETLWTLLRSHQERSALAERMAEREKSPLLTARLREKAREYAEDAEVIRGLIAEQTDSAPTDTPEANIA